MNNKNNNGDRFTDEEIENIGKLINVLGKIRRRLDAEGIDINSFVVPDPRPYARQKKPKV